MQIDPKIFLWYTINGCAAWMETTFFLVGIVCMLAAMGFMALTSLFMLVKLLKKENKK